MHEPSRYDDRSACMLVGIELKIYDSAYITVDPFKPMLRTTVYG